VADWSRDLLDPREARRRAGAARALATCGWSAPLEWLERRWLAGDGAALEGVLLAASRGRVVPSLASQARVRELLVEAGLNVRQSDVAHRENRKPHLQVVLAVAEKDVAEKAA
jgi:hypothetical protein